MVEAFVDDLSAIEKANAEKADTTNKMSLFTSTEVSRIKDTLQKLVDKLLTPCKNEIKLFFRDEEIKINSSLNVYLSAKLKMRIMSKDPAEPLIRKGSFQEEQKGDLYF